MRKKLALSLIGLLMTACTGAINDFVAGGGSGGGNNRPPDPLPPVDLQATRGFKLSPGSVTATSATVNMHATITPTLRSMTSAAGNAQMSLHASPTK